MVKRVCVFIVRSLSDLGYVANNITGSAAAAAAGAGRVSPPLDAAGSTPEDYAASDPAANAVPLPRDGYGLHFRERRANGMQRLIGGAVATTILNESQEDKQLLQLLPEDPLAEPLQLTELEIKVLERLSFWARSRRGEGGGFRAVTYTRCLCGVWFRLVFWVHTAPEILPTSNR